MLSIVARSEICDLVIVNRAAIAFSSIQVAPMFDSSCTHVGVIGDAVIFLWEGVCEARIEMQLEKDAINQGQECNYGMYGI